MSELYRFNAVIHAWPTTACPPTHQVEIEGQSLTAADLDPTTLDAPLGCTFEEAGEQLEQLGFYFEPDGSFVWARAGLQLDGLLADRNERLLFVEIHGTCPVAFFDQILTLVGWPKVRLLFQLPRAAIFLEEDAFRKYAAGGQ